MRRGLVVVVVLAALLAGVLFWFFGVRNRLVRLDEGVNSAWSQVASQYQRRMDLIPNLVETVKGVAQFEQDTFTQVAEARAKAGQTVIQPGQVPSPAQFQQFEQSQGQLTSALSRLLVTVEKYPELKAGANFQQLQDELAGTENRIAVERRRFNETVQAYNTTTRLFPTSVVAGMSGFAQRPYFQAQAGAETAPAVKF